MRLSIYLYSVMLQVLFHVTEIIGKILLDRKHSVQSYCSSYTRLLILFNVLITVHRVYDYH